MRPGADLARMATKRRSHVTKPNIHTTSLPTDIPPSTRWHRAHGRPTRKDKAINQQYLTPQEEKALKDELLRLARNGYPVRVKFLPAFAHMIARQWSSHSGINQDVRPPNHNWPQSFKKRHPDIASRRLMAIGWERNGPDTYEEVAYWFEIMEAEVKKPNVLPENVYNMEETVVI